MQHVLDTCFVICTPFLIAVARKCWYESRWRVMHTISPLTTSTNYSPFPQGKWGKATVTTYWTKAQFIHCSWYHHHKHEDFSLVCWKSEEGDTFTVNLALQEQGAYCFFVKTEDFISRLLLGIIFFWFSSPLLPTPLKNAEEIRSTTLPQQNFFIGKSLALLPLS